MRRSNLRWLLELRERDALQEVALDDLRRSLLRGLRRALSDYQGVGGAFVEDVTQEAMVRILNRLDQFEGRSSFETWATTIAIHIALSELRRRRWADVSLDGLLAAGAEHVVVADAVPGSVGARTSPPERPEVVSQLYETIQQQLTDKQRTALIAELKGMPLADIARLLGSTRSAVHKLTHDARKRLKRGLVAAGYGPEDIRAAFSP